MGMFPSSIRIEMPFGLIIICMTGWAAGNSLIFGEYALKAFLNHDPSSLLLKLTSFACVTLTFLLHGTAVEWGLRLQNVLGVFKLFVLAMVAVTGLVALKNGIPTVASIQQEEYQWRGRQILWVYGRVQVSALHPLVFAYTVYVCSERQSNISSCCCFSGDLVIHRIFECELRYV